MDNIIEARRAARTGPGTNNIGLEQKPPKNGYWILNNLTKVIISNRFVNGSLLWF
jgi:hypothetical protein